LALKPIYHKALLKIDTSIQIEGTHIDKLDISDDV
jgi:hypothetical protein